MNGSLYRERTQILSHADADADADVDTDVDTDTDTDTDTTGETGVPEDRDGDGWDASVDCNDADEAIHPGACEICEDGVDQDCFPDEPACHPPLTGTLDLGTVGVAYDGVNPQDYAGIAVSDAGDVNGDGFGDVLVGASTATPGAVVKAGSAYLLLAPFDDGSLANAAARYDGDDTDDRAGVAVAGLDLDADGFSDLVIGSKLHDEGAVDQGAAYVVYGQPGPLSAFNRLSESAAMLLGETDSQAGGTLAAMGNGDGEGGDDLLVGAEIFDSSRGAVFIVPGRPDRFLAGVNQSLSNVGARIAGEEPGDLFGSSLDGAGDVDGDGLDDAVIGALNQDGQGTLSGAAYVVFGRDGGNVVSAGDSDYKLVGELSGDHAGTAVSGGDLDNDGLSDVVVGARTHGADRGAVYVVTGGSLGTIPSPSVVQLSQGDARILGENEGDRLGQAAAVVGDTNCDGYADLLVGADRYQGERGAAYLLFGPIEGGHELAEDADVVRMYGTAGTDDTFGAYLSGAGDLDHDGAADLIIGAYKAQDADQSQAGRVWLLFGSH